MGAALTALALLAAPVSAEPYPAEAPAATVSTAVVAPGGEVTFYATGFIPGETVSITVSYSGTAMPARAVAMIPVSYQAGAASTRLSATSVAAAGKAQNVIADGSGSISTGVVLSQTGTATITATGLTSGVTVSQTVIVAAGAAGDEALAVTGGRTSAWLRNALLAGGALVLLGSFALWMAMRRRRAELV
ncbi:hypothetical protein [Pilimelia columellifera]|uniref:Sortase n=1 Tax=Pilimelia columellifera subsp. columellifera TaxID=706583 RepID=A0ABP6B291_9ACTN